MRCNIFPIQQAIIVSVGVLVGTVSCKPWPDQLRECSFQSMPLCLSKLRLWTVSACKRGRAWRPSSSPLWGCLLFLWGTLLSGILLLLLLLPAALQIQHQTQKWLTMLVDVPSQSPQSSIFLSAKSKKQVQICKGESIENPQAIHCFNLFNTSSDHPHSS